MRAYLRASFVLLLSAAPAIVLFLGLLAVPYGSQIVPILMYRGVLLALIAGLIQFGLLAYFLRDPKTTVGAVALAFAINVTFLVVVPVTIDRSVTVFLLARIPESGVESEALRHQMISEYVTEFGAVERRLNEQLVSGNVRLEGERYYLTPQGERFLVFCRYLIDWIAMDRRLVNHADKEQ